MNVIETQALRVLIIDDDPHFRGYLRELLARIDEVQEEVVEAGTLTDGIAALTARSFDLVLLDLKLPNGVGVATFERLIDSRAVPPVVIITGAASEADALVLLSRGAQGYLPKQHVQRDSLRRAVLHARARWKGVEHLVVERARVLAKAFTENASMETRDGC